ncbi:MAG: protein-glutamate O-methyltransferase [Acetobacteraceae bacterium]|nr:protein-glutamate O-methyltransferase [Acetobacteraceae bacterium]
MGHLSAGKSVLAEGEIAFTPKDFSRIAAIMREDAGISLPVSKTTLVYSRLSKRIRVLGLRSFEEYCSLVADPKAAERRQLLTALTTNVTRFFREPHHFDHLKTKVLPPLLEAVRKGASVRLWSAACSSGQEPYSIGLTLLSLMPDVANYDVRILATDIDPSMVRQGREGIYDAATLEPVPADMRRWFVRAGSRRESELRVGDELQRLVVFQELNLVGKWPMKRRFQAIFCRNVVIYFDDDTQAKLWERLTPILEPGGTLYVGHSERINGPAAARLSPDGITTYRLPANEGE